MAKALFTSFDIWDEKQASNSSDELLAIFENESEGKDGFFFLRKLAVDNDISSEKVKRKLDDILPDYLVLCGMAESRIKLSVESGATLNGSRLRSTALLLDTLAGTVETEISDDCGSYVCNHLYYTMLDYCRMQHPHIKCVFVHVPLLNENNSETILKDFRILLKNIGL
jgi:pyroglutamyl-peptidase